MPADVGRCRYLFIDEYTQEAKPSQAPLRKKPDLRIATWNLQDFLAPNSINGSNQNGSAKIDPVKPKGYRVTKAENNTQDIKPKSRHVSVYPKSKKKIRAAQEVIADIGADIFVLNEVVGEKSTRVLDPHKEYLHIGNTPVDSRGLQTTFMVKKHLNVDVELYLPSSINESVSLKRGLPTLLLRQKNADGFVDVNAKPDLMIMGVHLLSQLRLEGDRLAEVKKGEAKLIADAARELEAMHPDVPLLIMGDFNIHLPAKFKTKDLEDTFVRSIHNLLPEAKPEEATYSYIRILKKQRKSVFITAQTLDSLSINETASRRLIDSFVYRFRDENAKDKVYKDHQGNESLVPVNHHQRKQNPSDHMPVVADFNME